MVRWIPGILAAACCVAWMLPKSTDACDRCGESSASLSSCPWAAPFAASAATPDGDAVPIPELFRTQGNGWTSTSSGTSSLGSPVTATWSIVPDGTPITRSGAIADESRDPSSLVSLLDSIHHNGESPGGSDLTQRAWWALIDSAFQRWESIAGVTFNYEPNDNGSTLPTSSGQLGVRGDHRISGHSIDGQTSPTVLAYNYFPNFSDMVLDTDEVTRWSNSFGNYQLFRNTLMHEIGHGLGLNHMESDDVSPLEGHQFGSFLMEPILTLAFDGPQFDDILGAHRLYGDIYEKGAGNQTVQTATDLGTLAALQSIEIGTDADDNFVAFTDVDFVSIDDNSDIDFFSFKVDAPMTIDVLLTPMGPSYMEGAQGSAEGGTQNMFDASALGDLNLALFDTNGTSILHFANTVGLGISEQILAAQLPAAGEYFVRVAGVTNHVQMYQLEIASVPEPAAALLLAAAAPLGLAIRRSCKLAASRASA